MGIFSLRRPQILGGVVVVIIIGVTVFFLYNDNQRFPLDALIGRKPLISSLLECDSDLLHENILSARRNSDETLRLFIHFSERPSADVVTFFGDMDIKLYPNTWIFDYLVAETTVKRLCYLAGLPGITSIELGE